MNISPFLSINHSCEKALQWTREQLLRTDLYPVQTFDLHTARAALHDCPCPCHGTDDCDCQMVVLLVYGQAAEEPVTLILHGNDGQTWLSLVGAPEQETNAKIVSIIRSALDQNPPFQISNLTHESEK